MNFGALRVRRLLPTVMLMFFAFGINIADAACFYDSNNEWVEEYKRSFGSGSTYDRKVVYVRKKGTRYSKAPSGVTKGSVKSTRRTRTVETCIGEGGEFCDIFFTEHEEKSEVCYAVLAINGYNYNKNTRTGTSNLKTDSGRSVSSVKYELLNGSAVVHSVSGTITGSGTSYTSSFNLSGAKAGTYTLRITAKDSGGDTETETRSIVIDAVAFSNYSYDKAKDLAKVTIKDVGKAPQKVVANILNSDGSIVASVQGAQTSAIDENFTYSFNYRVVPSGDYTIQIIATDTWGEQFAYNNAMHDGESSVRIDAVEILAFDYNPKTRQGSITLRDYWDNPQAAFLELRSGEGVTYHISAGARQANGDRFTYPFWLDNAPVGTHNVWALVTDGNGDGNEIQVGSVTVEPLEFFNYKFTPETQTATIDIKDVGENPRLAKAVLFDDSGNVAVEVVGVQTLANSENFTYAFQYGGVPSGDYTIEIRATDTWGNEFVYTDLAHQESGDASVHLITAEFKSFVYDEVTRDGVVYFEDLGKSPKNGKAVLVSQDNPEQVFTVDAVLNQDENDEAKFSYSFNLNNQIEGYYTLSFDIVDSFSTTVSNEYLQVILIDKTAPSITFGQMQEIRAVADIEIRVEDTFDENPIVLGVKLTGGPDSIDVDLGATLVDGNLVLPEIGLFPSLDGDDEPYTITVSTIDHQNNESVRVASFSYTTEIVTALDGMDNKLWLPAVNYQFLRKNGKDTISTEPIVDVSGDLLTGEHDAVAFLSADSPAPISINNITIHPGERADIGKVNFSETKGRLSVLAHAVQDGATGTATVLITTSAPYAPAVLADLHLWNADVTLESKQWEYRQVIDKLDIIAMPSVGVPCRTTVSDESAMDADVIRDPACLIEWTETPDEAEVADGFKSNMKVAGLAGQAVKIGQQNISYEIYLYSGDGQKILVGEGSRPIEVVSALGAIELGISRDVPSIYRTVQDVDITFKQIKGPLCDVTLDASQAIKTAASTLAGSRSQRMSCLFEWQDMTGTLVQDKYSTVPKVLGQLDELGEHDLKWRLSTFSKAGVRVTLAEQTETLNVIDPPAPVITLNENKAQIVGDENVLIAPIDAASFGDVDIRAVNSEIIIDVMRDGELLSSDTTSVSRYEGEQSYTRSLAVPQSDPLWSDTRYKVTASYARLPEIGSELDIQAFVAPKSSVRPQVVSDTQMAVDTELLPLSVEIRDSIRFRDPYDENTMGVWETRVIREDSKNGQEPITDWKQTENGVADFNVALGEVDSRAVHFLAEARLVSPIEGYERIEKSQRPLFFTVLLGGEIGANVVTRKLSGEAPYNITFKAMLQERDLYASTGEITWQISSDNGATWKSETPPDRYKFQYSTTLNKGNYLVRALITNKYSGIQSATEMVEIVVYEKPELIIDGSSVVFAGSTETLTARPVIYLFNEETGEIEQKGFDLDDTSIQWSLDGGKTFTETGSQVTISSNDPARYYVWAKVRSSEAPIDDQAAYTITKKTLEFKQIRPPRVRVVGPSIVETGETYQFSVVKDLPYAKMNGEVKGFFTMPDGSTVEADSVQYTPSEDELLYGYLNTTYTAWVDGWRDAGAEGSSTLRSRVWQYTWPKFTVDYRASADVAPAEINLRVRTTNYGGKLDNPKYDWTIADGVRVTDAQNPLARTLYVEEPGSYVVSITVSDARGHESVLNVPIEIGTPEPYKLELSYTSSPAILREPVDITLRAKVSGGHPRDRLEDIQWQANGNSIEGTKTFGRTTLSAGEHNVGVTITSAMGITKTETTKIIVDKNKVPVCSLRSRETVGSISITADCVDEDGRIKHFEWNVDGDIRINSSRNLRINKKADEPLPSVSLVAVDDSGGRSEAVHFTGVD